MPASDRRFLVHHLNGCVLALAAGMGCSQTGKPSLETVQEVDLNRYLGTWYEIARYPAGFEQNCVASVAEYALRDDGSVDVVNRCRDGSFEGRERRIEGVARVVGKNTNARLKVSFFWPFEGDYWIIDLDPDYQWSVVGEPRRKYLWILSRTPTMDELVYRQILSRLPDKGYDPARLVRTPQEQPAGSPG